MTATELSPKDRTLIQSSAKLRAYADALDEGDADDFRRTLAQVLRRIAQELWELVEC